MRFERVAVVGSRSILDRHTVFNTILHSPFTGDSSPARWDVTLVSGGADGVDSLAEDFAEKHGIEMEALDPDWDDWSNGHPAKWRNTEIVKRSDAVIAVWDGHSNGTRDTIEKALDRGKPTYVEVTE